MDMTASLEARSDQINAADLMAGPRTYTIEKVVKGVANHPFDFHLVESPGKAYRPNTGMRRVIAAGWGPETSDYTGRRLTLFNEPTVIYAGVAVGGIRVSHMSHLDEPLKTSLAISQKKKVPYTVQPLIEDGSPPAEPSAVEVAGCIDPDVLRQMWRASGPQRRAQIEARIAELAVTSAGPHDGAGSDEGKPGPDDSPAQATDPVPPLPGDKGTVGPPLHPLEEPPDPDPEPVVDADGVVVAEVIEDPVAAEPLINAGQRTKIVARLGDLDVDAADRSGRLRMCSTLVGRPLGSANDITDREASSLIDTLTMCHSREDLDNVLRATEAHTLPLGDDS